VLVTPVHSLVAINRNAWSQSIGTGGRNHPVRAGCPWAKRGPRPSAPRDQRTASTYIFGAVCPEQGKGWSKDLFDIGQEVGAVIGPSSTNGAMT
jgi:hypothetical protein